MQRVIGPGLVIFVMMVAPALAQFPSGSRAPQPGYTPQPGYQPVGSFSQERWAGAGTTRPSYSPPPGVFPNYADAGATPAGVESGLNPLQHSSEPSLSQPYPTILPTYTQSPISSGMAPTGWSNGETLMPSVSPLESAVSGNCNNGCATCPAPCAAAPCCPCPWFGGVAGLFMGRDRANKFWTSADGDHPENQVMNTNDPGTPFQGGAEVRFGRYFGGPGFGIGGAALGGAGNCCGGYAIEAAYWALSPLNGYSFVDAPSISDGLVTPIILNAPPVPMIGPYRADDYFDGALKHELWRRDYLQNIEINFWRLPFFMPTQRFQVNWMAGVRYFRFTDDLVFGATSGSTTIPEIYGTKGYLDTKMINNLVGFQIGGRGNLFLTRALSIYAQPIVGVFGNHATSRMHMYNDAGDQGFNYSGKLNDVALLGQIDLGTQWFLTPRWSVFAAYRVIGVSGVGLADNQIPTYMNDTPAIQDVHSNGSLIVSGGVFGTWFAY